MTYEQPSSLAFSIKESVWLREGEEIDELLSLALEPDISIREADDQVFIRGSLLLFGEYKPKEQDSNSNSYSDQISFRSVEEVTMSDDGIGMIRHSFPLDVTIPREKINRLEDLYVTVDAFDYELPGKGCIELEANVSVSGIKHERTEEPEDTYDEQQDEESDDYYTRPQEYNDFSSEREEMNERSFHFEAVREAAADDETKDEYESRVEEIKGESKEFQNYERNAAFEQHYEEEDQYEQEENNEEPVSYNTDPEIEPEYEGETEPEPEPEPAPEPELVRSEPTVNFSPQPSPVSAVEETHELEEEGEEEAGRDQTEKSSSSKDENALYLTKMLTKGDQEEFSKLRMCIVQDGESLETIAERYNIQVSNLIRMNRLNEERVAEGQILYIPVKQTPTSKS
ncbi:stage VI sporulation protein D [Evansella vedderi]|uniref:Stage VI sporulation protein D n=1 Tax=Evansella vedderi TaxID=38282 RepID=A0ABT9ZZV6_9BACI|nr:stage VI sporulation protein D [Evansella vedderi]MDQ0256490.1 stage VI sporulation protein D [Evansella vedderi]